MGVVSKIRRLVLGRSKISNDFLDALEEVLISSDVGVNTTIKIIEGIQKRVSKEKYFDEIELRKILADEIVSILPDDIPMFGDSQTLPKVALVVGVNGVGKTTTIGKLAHRYTSENKRVVLGAADTFRVAAIDQLQIWAERTSCTIIKQQHGSDPASVAYDTVKSGLSKNADVILIDTAGRLHNKLNLMNELAKMGNVIKNIIPDAPHEVLLVLDGSTGQNALEQAKQFSEATNVTALAITKLDGTARGGTVIGISDQMNIPIKFIGVGEGIHDLQKFDKYNFVKTLLTESKI
ncbi:signal recognition particle receptor FtsY [Elysia marginata]|uniref:Signal recognition particle receptor FtsY n=1 Tax=Elysia marginata TaxID=1093978 RepID=A0AAV4JPP1_9GAST|nr:signal recognition particle receptor FtsY [Elysia marginata]